MDLDRAMTFVLVLVRVASIMAFLPIIGEGNVPQAVKALASVVISLVLMPVAGAAQSLHGWDAAQSLHGWDAAQFFLYVGAEVLFGVLIGTASLLTFRALGTAGEMVGQQMGMALEFVADPLTGEETSPVSTFCEVVGVMVFFAVGGHLWMIQAIHDSLVQWPLGAFVAPDFAERVTLSAAARSMEMAFQIAAPMLLLSFLVSLTMAVMARLVPEMNILIVGFPLKVSVGLIGLVVFLPLLVQCCGDVARAMAALVGNVSAGG